MTFPLSDQPVLGEWFIFVEMQGHVYNKSFEVQKYGKPETLRGSPLGETTDPATTLDDGRGRRQPHSLDTSLFLFYENCHKTHITNLASFAICKSTVVQH